jgi:methyl-accepting chemotaxis protein
MKFNIGNKLFAAFGTLLILLALVGLVSWHSITTLSTQLESLYENNLKAAVYLANAQDALWQLRYGFPQFLVLGEQERAAIVADEAKWYQVIDENLKAYAAGARTPEEMVALKEWETVYTQYIQARPRWFELQGAGKIEEAAEWRAQTTTPYGKGAVAALGRLIDLQRQVATEKEQEALATVVTSTWLLIGTIGLALGIGLVVTFVLTRNIVTPLTKMTEVAQAVRVGNLDIQAQVTSQDEIGVLANAFNQVITYQQQMAEVASQLAQGDVSAHVTPQSERDVLSHAFSQMIAYQQQMAKVADRLAQGDVSANITPQSDKDALGHAFSQMIVYQQQMAKVADRLAQGDVSANITPQSERDVLSHAFSQMIAYQQQMAQVAGRLSQGDLTANVLPKSDKDALGHAFNVMIANLRSLVGQVIETANTVGGASGQLSTAADQAGQASQQVTSTIQQVAAGAAQQTQAVTEATKNVKQMARVADTIAKGAQEQAQSVQKTSDLIGQMSQLVDQVGQTARSAHQANTKATQVARQGVTRVEQTTRGMDAIRARSLTAADKVREMGGRSKEISSIVETIDDIADKTDMLALNAAVEAARAGEYGRGFAVVAEQVRKLSEDSKGATRNIATLIERVQESVQEAISAMEGTINEVNNGTHLTQDTSQSLEEILQAAEEAAVMAEQISGTVSQLRQKSENVVMAIETVSTVVEENTTAAEEVAGSAQGVMQAIEGVVSVAEENSASAEEVSASAEEMSAQVEEVVTSAQDLSTLAEQLWLAITQFRVEEANSFQAGQSGRTISPAYATAGYQPAKPVPALAKHQSNGGPDEHRPRRATHFNINR